LTNSTSETPKIVITFPTTYTLAATWEVSGTSGGLSSVSECAAPNSGGDSKYELSDPFTAGSYTSSATNLVLNIGRVTNPTVSGNPGSFTVQTYITEGTTDYLVDTGSYSSVTINAGSLLSPSASSNSTEAYATDALYTVSFTAQHAVPTNGYIIVNLPSGIQITDSGTAVSQCQTSIDGGAFAAASWTVASTTQIKFSGFTPAIAATNTVSVRIGGIR
jgi:hypothetical protein